MEEMKNLIVEILTKNGGSMTANEIRKKNKKLKNFSISKIYGLLMWLKFENKIKSYKEKEIISFSIA